MNFFLKVVLFYLLFFSSFVWADVATLKKGWNLTGVNSNLTLEELKSKLGEDNLLSISGAGKSYKITNDEVANNFLSLEPGYGYWIKLSEQKMLDYIPEIYENEIVDLKKGWNLINPMRDLSLQEIKNSLGEGNLLSIRGAEKVYKSTNNEVLNNFTKFEEPNGYWIKVLNDSKLDFIVINVGPTNRQDASRFLTRATFGATKKDIDNLVNLASYEEWIEEQFAKPANLHIEWAHKNVKGAGGAGDLKDNLENWRAFSDDFSELQRDAWFDIAINGEDQLRQRVAFALSEIMVISKNSSLLNFPHTRMSYYDVLVKNAFGNFETLLREVTYHPAMGRYLNYIGNQKANEETGTHPDENYAREIMQLFSIGLYQLNIDGTKKLDENGKALRTYNQENIMEMAKVFTGLSDQNGFFLIGDGSRPYKSETTLMIGNPDYEKYHDRSKKEILKGEFIEANGDTITDINKAINILHNHQNTGPFITRILIQRLVTSNPSAQYIKRVSLVFNNNGQGVRGDMKAVVKAILLDKEALKGSKIDTATFGKAKEPLLFTTGLLRAFDAKINPARGKDIIKNGDANIYEYETFNLSPTDILPQKGPLEALTVFNYFTPDDAPFNLKKDNLAAPEFELFGTGAIHEYLMAIINKNDVYTLYGMAADLQIEYLVTLVDEKKYNEFLNHLDELLVGGNLAVYNKELISQYILENKELPSDTLVRYVISLVITSPDFAVQR